MWEFCLETGRCGAVILGYTGLHHSLRVIMNDTCCNLKKKVVPSKFLSNISSQSLPTAYHTAIC